MYCRKCGKQINYDAPYCLECQEMDALFITPEEEQAKQRTQESAYTAAPAYQPAPQPLQGDRKEGFGKALASTILAVVSYFLVCIALGVIGALDTYSYYGYSYASDEWAAAMVFMLMSIGTAVPALIMGIQSMKCFFRQKREGKVKPVATLVLGIVGMATSAFTLTLALFMLLIVSALV